MNQANQLSVSNVNRETCMWRAYEIITFTFNVSRMYFCFCSSYSLLSWITLERILFPRAPGTRFQELWVWFVFRWFRTEIIAGFCSRMTMKYWLFERCCVLVILYVSSNLYSVLECEQSCWNISLTQPCLFAHSNSFHKFRNFTNGFGPMKNISFICVTRGAVLILNHKGIKELSKINSFCSFSFDHMFHAWRPYSSFRAILGGKMYGYHSFFPPWLWRHVEVVYIGLLNFWVVISTGHQGYQGLQQTFWVEMTTPCPMEMTTRCPVDPKLSLKGRKNFSLFIRK